jgi:hypothetical protein
VVQRPPDVQGYARHVQNERVVSAAELERLTPQEREDLVRSRTVRSWDEVPQELRAKINETAQRLGEQRRARA